MKKELFIFSLLLLLASCGKETPAPGPVDDNKINWNAAADSSSTSLYTNFWNMSENFFNDNSEGKSSFQYWPNAHALDVMIDAYLRTGDNTYKVYFDKWFDGVKRKNGNTFRNDFYDDMEWNGLAILRAYQVTKEAKYKEAALQIWEYIKEGWNTQAGGGITWKKGMEYSKNACSNGPACILAARLYREFGDKANKEWAEKIYAWEKSVLFNPNNGMVYDNIDARTGTIQKSWIFTYNEGTFIGSAVELYKILGEKSYLNDATLAADYTISTLVENSVLKSEGTGDGGLFKGIFVRYFVELMQQDRLDSGTKKRYMQFLQYNAETLWTKGTNKTNVFFGDKWAQKPGASTGLTEQLSGCMLIEAMARMSDVDRQ